MFDMELYFVAWLGFYLFLMTYLLLQDPSSIIAALSTVTISVLWMQESAH